MLSDMYVVDGNASLDGAALITTRSTKYLLLGRGLRKYGDMVKAGSRFEYAINLAWHLWNKTEGIDDKEERYVQALAREGPDALRRSCGPGDSCFTSSVKAFLVRSMNAASRRTSQSISNIANTPMYMKHAMA